MGFYHTRENASLAPFARLINYIYYIYPHARESQISTILVSVGLASLA